RETRSLARGSVHAGNLAACRPCAVAGAPRIHDQSILDGLVIGAAPRVAAMDRSWDICPGGRSTLLDLPQPWEQLDGYRGHQESAHPGHARSVSMGPPPLLRLRGFADCRDLSGCVELVPHDD